MFSNISAQLSKAAFIFLIFAVISGGYVRNILSCQMQEKLTNSMTMRHSIGILLIFVFIMLEGGWDFDEEEQNRFSNDWSSGNALHSFLYAIGIYIIFILSSKSRFIPNMIFFGLLFILYIINTQKNYLTKREKIDEGVKNNLEAIQKILIVLVSVSFLYSLYDYISYKKKKEGKRFDWLRFFVGTTGCRGIDCRKHLKVRSCLN